MAIQTKYQQEKRDENWLYCKYSPHSPPGPKWPKSQGLDIHQQEAMQDNGNASTVDLYSTVRFYVL